MATQTQTNQGETETPVLDLNPTPAASPTSERIKQPVAVSSTRANEAPTPQRGIISLIASQLWAFNDWLGGPALTKRGRDERKMRLLDSRELSQESDKRPSRPDSRAHLVLDWCETDCHLVFIYNDIIIIC